MKKIGVLLFLASALVSGICMAADALFEVTLVIPEYGQGGRHLCYAQERCTGADFHVIIKNISDHPQNVFQVCNSWGYDNISFQIEYEGRSISLTRKDFTKPGDDAPVFWVIYPGEYRVYDISLKDYKNVPSLKGQSRPAKIKAIYRLSHDLYNPLRTFDFRGFWFGSVESAPLTVMLGECSVTPEVKPRTVKE